MSTTAARLIRSVLYATGSITCVPYFTTEKFTPQITAIITSANSVERVAMPWAGTAVEDMGEKDSAARRAGDAWR